MKLVPRISCLIPPFALILCHIEGSGETKKKNLLINLLICIFYVFQWKANSFSMSNPAFVVLLFIPLVIHALVQVRWENKRRSKIIFLISELTDISGISDKLARIIMDQYPTLESIQDASVEQLFKIPGVGENIAKAIKTRLG